MLIKIEIIAASLELLIETYGEKKMLTNSYYTPANS